MKSNLKMLLELMTARVKEVNTFEIFDDCYPGKEEITFKKPLLNGIYATCYYNGFTNKIELYKKCLFFRTEKAEVTVSDVRELALVTEFNNFFSELNTALRDFYKKKRLGEQEEKRLKLENLFE